jgi:hypothetical protein
MVFFSLIIISLCILVASGNTSGSDQNQHFANIATMYLLTPVIILCLPILAIIIGLIYLISKTIPYIPHYGALIEEKMDKANHILTQMMNKVASPFISLPAYVFGFRHYFADLMKNLRRNFHHE